ncbi:MAG: histidine--tRNA ligase, partial [Clostridia bacterium]|nr:histidine--tRNA ligase [Clostridia bacterium]
YKEIRVPTFEHTELFERGVGDTTDVVEKQMYTFNDKGGRSITLRPEGTASVVRSFLQNSLYALPMPMKAFYNIACFRYENKQKGRLREFHQFGVEAFGAQNATMDAEIVSLAINFLTSVGLTDLSVNINSIGCPECRKAYSDALKEYLKPRYDELCDTCKGRFERNPLRIIDCKSEVCQDIVKNAPTLLDYICDDCREHFEQFKACLDAMGVKYTIDSGIVRGLDYYTKTVFEIISGDFTVCGGGRYDGLVEELGGKSTPAVGFGLGIERLLLRLEENGVEIPKPDAVKLYIAPIGEGAISAAQKLAYDLRKAGVSVDTDHLGRGLRASMKYADKLGAQNTLVLGDNEIETGTAKIKNMATGEETEVSLDAIAEYLG